MNENGSQAGSQEELPRPSSRRADGRGGGMSKAGMTYEQALFRDRCAIAVLGGVVANGGMVSSERAPRLPEFAYELADLMLEARGAEAQKAIDVYEADAGDAGYSDRALWLRAAALAGVLAGGEDDIGSAVKVADMAAQHAGKEGWLE